MGILFVYDSYILHEKTDFGFIGCVEKVYLFPLTSKHSITLSMYESLKKNRCDVEYLNTAELINSGSDELKAKYIRFIAELPEKVKHNNRNLKELFSVDKYATLWWFSLVSEKNTFKSDTFNTLAQLDLIVRTVKQKQIKRILFGCNKPKLREGLSEYARKNSLRFEILPVSSGKGLRNLVKNYQRMFWFKNLLIIVYTIMLNFRKARKIAKYVSKLKRDKHYENNLMIITYYPYVDTILAQNGIFRNSYYGKLQEGLEKEGINIVWIAMPIYSNSIPFEDSLRYAQNFIKNNYSIFFIDEFGSLGVYLKALIENVMISIKFLKIQKKIHEAHTFGDYNFYHIFKDDWYASFGGAAGFSSLVYYYIYKKIFHTFKSKACLYCCEMHAWEKALISARDALSKGTLLLGYQSGTISQMLLNYFNDPLEVRGGGGYALPKPEKLICNGEIPLRYMKDSGWHDRDLTIAEAIRYDHLKNANTTNIIKKRNVVLLLFSINPDEASAILSVAYNAFNDLKNLEVWMRPHPSLSIKKVFELSNIEPDNCSFEIKNGVLPDILQEARIVIAGETGTSIEALKFGCNLIVVNCPEWINMSPLKSMKAKMVMEVSSPEELKQVVIDEFKKEYDPMVTANDACRIINEFFFLNNESDIPETFLSLLRKVCNH